MNKRVNSSSGVDIGDKFLILMIVLIKLLCMEVLSITKELFHITLIRRLVVL